MADLSDTPLDIHSTPGLNTTRNQRVVVATDGSLIGGADGRRVITGAAVTRIGRWLAFRRVLPAGNQDAGAGLAEVLAPLLAIDALGYRNRITVITDNTAVMRWLPSLVGPNAIVPRHLTGAGFALPTVREPHHLVVDHRDRIDPFIGVAHSLAAQMHSARHLELADLTDRLNRIVRDGLGLTCVPHPKETTTP